MPQEWSKVNQEHTNSPSHTPKKDALVKKPSKGPVVSTVPLGHIETPKPRASQSSKQKDDDVVKRETVKRSGGGKKWEDKSLLEWDPTHFRLFVGNLSAEVTDEMLDKAFSRFPSLSKVKVVKDPSTQKAKGYGFVAFSDAEDYFKAFKEMNGKYVGNHPVQLKRATTEIKRSTVKERSNVGKNRSRPYNRR